MDCCAVENPLAIADREENIAAVLNAFQSFAICAAANSLRCEQTDAVAIGMLDQVARLFEPVTAKIGLRFDTVSVVRKDCIDIFISEFVDFLTVTP
jgi:hypothetical protein